MCHRNIQNQWTRGTVPSQPFGFSVFDSRVSFPSLSWKGRTVRENRTKEKGIYYYYQVIKRELNRRPTYEYRCDERLKAKSEESTRLTYTGLREGLEHLKIEARLKIERFPSVMGECVI